MNTARWCAYVCALLILLCTAAASYAAELQDNLRLSWATSAGGSARTDVGIGTSISVLDDDSCLVAGSFSGTTTFGNGGNEVRLTSAGERDGFIARYNADGSPAWARRAGDILNDIAWRVAALEDGSSLVCGWSARITHVDHEIFLARYDRNGMLVWNSEAGGGGIDEAWGVSAFPDGSCVIAGIFQDAVTFGLGESNETLLTSAGERDVFVAKYNTDGTLAWAKRGGGEDVDYGTGVRALSDGSCLITGILSSDTATFGDSEQIQLIAAGGYDVFVAKYNSDGTLAWARRDGGMDSDYPHTLGALENGSCFVTGSFSGVATFGIDEPRETQLISAGNHDIFVAKYTAEGTLDWVTRFGGEEDDRGYCVRPLSDGSCLATGTFAGTATFGPEGETGLVSAGGIDIVVAKYTPEGELDWAGNIGGEDHERAWSMDTNGEEDYLVITGDFKTATSLDPAQTEEPLVASGFEDVFVAKYILGEPPEASFTTDVDIDAKTVTFHDRTTKGKAPYTVEWDLGDGTQVQNDTDFSHTYGQNGTYYATLRVTDAHGEVAQCINVVVVVHLKEVPAGKSVVYILIGLFCCLTSRRLCI
ncbi:PKD domain-containing protein [Candidatus Hydrogenedentota bacterium]